MSNSWIMEKVNSTDGHVQAGEFVIIPEDSRNTGWDINDSAITDTWADVDLSASVPAGTTVVYLYMLIASTDTATERMILNVRGYGQSATTGQESRTIRFEADIGASSQLAGSARALIYAPDGKFQYRRISSASPITVLRANLRGYYTK